MITRYEHKGLAWVDAASPSGEELAALGEEFHINPLVAEELRVPSFRPKADFYRDSLYLVLHFPAFRHTHGNDRRQEVDFIIGRKFLLTVRYDTIDALDKFSKEFETNSILSKREIGDHAGYLFHLLIKKLYRSLVHELEHIERRLDEVEGKIFRGEEEKMVIALSGIARDLLNFKQVIRGHEEILRSFDVIGRKFFGEEFAPHLSAILGEYERVRNALEGQKETLHELRSTNDSLLSAKINGVMRTLTAVTFATFPPAFIAWMFSMRAIHMPIIGIMGDFWILLGFMVASTAATFWLFAHKKWI